MVTMDLLPSPVLLLPILTAVCLMANVTQAFPLFLSTKPFGNLIEHESSFPFRKPIPFSSSFRSTTRHAIVGNVESDVTSLLNQDQEAGIISRAIYEAELMLPHQSELMEVSESDRKQALKQSKQNKRRKTSSSSSVGGGGFGGKTSKKTTKRSSSSTSNANTSTNTNQFAPPAIDTEGYTALLQQQGVIRINHMVSPQTCNELLQYINQEKIDAETAIATGTIDVRSRFADALLKTQRWDLLLPPLEESPLILKGLRELLHPQKAIYNCIDAAFGLDAELYELAALISDPGSQRQVIHPDIPVISDELSLMTCFVALQDVTLDMGPTVYIPETNTAQWHEVLNDKAKRDEVFHQMPNKVSLLQTGDCSVYDPRVLHAGGANDASSDRRRVLFYVTFRNPRLPDPRMENNPGSIREELKVRRITLRDIRKMVEEEEDEIGVV